MISVLRISAGRSWIYPQDVYKRQLEWDDDTDVKYRITIVSELKRTGLEIEKCETEIRNLHQNTTMIEKQIRADEMRKECEELKSHISKSDRERCV